MKEDLLVGLEINFADDTRRKKLYKKRRLAGRRKRRERGRVEGKGREGNRRKGKGRRGVQNRKYQRTKHPLSHENSIFVSSTVARVAVYWLMDIERVLATALANF